ncbi:hypothetical protein D3C87_1934270 [compost metagenome]
MLAVILCVAGTRLFVEQFAEHRVNIVLIADMLHSKVIEHRLQMLILTPQRLMRAARNFDVAVITHHGQNFLREDFVAQR